MTTNTKQIRAPKQKRSIDKKEKILAAAYGVFCSKGFYKTTTIEIARRAGVSIGCLYSYFKDKDDLFMVILDRYMKEFESVREKALFPADGKPHTHAEIVRSIMMALLQEHEATRELNREMKVLSYSNPAIAAHIEEQDAKIQRAIAGYLDTHRAELRVEDSEAATIVVWKLVSGIVDGIVFDMPPIDRARIIEAGVDALCAYLVK